MNTKTMERAVPPVMIAPTAKPGNARFCLRERSVDDHDNHEWVVAIKPSAMKTSAADSRNWG
jgi:hypothetical protein